MKKNQIKETPILMKPELVKATYNDIKTETRRIYQDQGKIRDARWNGKTYEVHLGYPTGHDMPVPPYGLPGDQLWVKETWRKVERQNGTGIAGRESVSGFIEYKAHKGNLLEKKLIYKNGTVPRNWADETWCQNKKWRSSLFMPRWASRLDLVIKEITLERIQQITEEGAKKEGVEYCFPDDIVNSHTYRELFISLWNDINEKPRARYRNKQIAYYESFPWEGGSFVEKYKGKDHIIYGNPLVWVIKYERIKNV